MFGLAMLAAQLPTLMIKIFSSRLRPVIAEAHWLNVNSTPRLVHIHKFVDTPKEARESFPSGDAVGAGVFYGVLAYHTQNFLWMIPVLFTLFGRVYFWAHHLGDVSAGCGIGMGVAYLLHVLCGSTILTIWHLAVSLPPFIVAYSSLSKYRGRSHPHHHIVPDIPKVD
jgi:membrane-associated phospholipid phosphatase